MGKMLGGGVETVVMNYYRHIDRSKVQFDFLVDSDSTRIPREEIESLGGRVFLIPPYQNQYAYQRGLETLFRERRWPIVHSHVNALSVFPLMVAKRAGVPVRIAHSHSTANPNELAKTAIKDVLRTQANRYPTARFACGRYAGEWLFGRGVPFEVMTNAIDLGRFAFSSESRKNVRAELDIAESAFVVLHMGRFVEQKNHRFLVTAFASLLKRRPDAVLLLAGDGPLRTEIERKVNDLGISAYVRFLGQRSDAPALYSAADVFCLPSLYEGLPVVGVEAQASGLPILMSTDVSDEAIITSRARSLPRDAGAAAWANMLATLDDGYRTEPLSYEDTRALDAYDVTKQGAWLTSKYLQLCYEAQESSESTKLLLIDTEYGSADSASDKPTIGVLMSTYNGEKYLQEQVDSIAVQDGVNVEMFIRDDGSSDSTSNIIQEMVETSRGCISSWHFDRGENLGFLGSFERLLSKAEGCEYYAFSDQDDFWLPEKLSRAIGALQAQEGPSLYASTVTIVDEELNMSGKNDFPGFVYSIPSELIRHRLAGHTLVWNAALQREIVKIGSLPCWSHDQHVILAALIVGAPLYLDHSSYALHRRVAASVTPGGEGIAKRVHHELGMLWNVGRKADRAALARAILDIPNVALDDADRRFLAECADGETFELIRDSSFDCGLVSGNAEAKLSVLLGRF